MVSVVLGQAQVAGVVYMAARVLLKGRVALRRTGTTAIWIEPLCHDAGHVVRLGRVIRVGFPGSNGGALEQDF
jgi:hypothetical protein